MARCALLLGVLVVCAGVARGAEPVSVSVDWGKTVLVCRSTPTLQVVVNPMLRRGSAIHDSTFAALRDLGADYVRFVPWLPYPRLGVAELEAPTATSTSWDFSLIDPIACDFLDATAEHSTVMNFSTIPAWLFKTDAKIKVPADANQVYWNYTQGTELRDPSGKALGDYYARLVSWYTSGGFVDERGVRHESGHHYPFPYWEVLNEVDSEHAMTPEQYTARYDAIVSAIHGVSRSTRFVGMALAFEKDLRWFSYFLNPANHRAGIPLDFISYHFYATPGTGEGPDSWQRVFFGQADGFLANVRKIEEIRAKLSPGTRTDIDELGVILPNDNGESSDVKGMLGRIPGVYWNAAGSLYAYLYVNLSRLGIDVIGESQLVGYPSQYPSVSMMDWSTGKPNARFWVLKLIKDHFSVGDAIVSTRVSDSGAVEGQGFLLGAERKLILCNKCNRAVTVGLPDSFTAYRVWTVDEASGEGAARVGEGVSRSVELAPFAVAVVVQAAK